VNSGKAMGMVVLIDNYDSFVYNLYQYVGELGYQPHVVRNDAIDCAGISELEPSHIVISPGPCTPLEAGISNDAIVEFAGKIPILGVCLGHQAIGHVFGGEVVRADRVVHGKTSMIYHRAEGVLRNLPIPFEATRYHSLVIKPETIPDCLQITAWTDQNEIMGVRHRAYDNCPIEGVQFHPEAILTTVGHDLLRNFLAYKRAR